MATFTDTHASAADVQLRLLREATPARRFALTCSLSSTVVRLARQGLRTRHPELTEEELGLLFVEVHYGRELAERVLVHRNGAALTRRPKAPVLYASFWR